MIRTPEDFTPNFMRCLTARAAALRSKKAEKSKQMTVKAANFPSPGAAGTTQRAESKYLRLRREYLTL